MARVAPFARFAPLAIGPRDRVFVLTGAGISAESGIRTFRDANGLWEEHRVEDVASPEGWARNAALVWRFYAQRRAQVRACSPNAAHVALARLEDAIGDRLFLCTQNVDPLHERAGSKRVVHMHGELLRSRCERCDRPDFADEGLYETASSIPRCACGARIRPHICWFGEIPYHLDVIGRALDACDVFVTVGSSGVVHPAAGFVRRVRARGGVRTVYIGPEAPENDGDFDEHRIGRAGEALLGMFDAR